MIRGLLFVLAMAFLPAPASLEAQEPRLLERLDARTAERVSSLVRSARDAGLPTEPLIQKALEGAAKGASPRAILAAVSALSGQLTEARRALGGSAREAEIVAGAAALKAGADAAIIGRLRAARGGGEPVTVPLSMLTDLIAQGVPADTAGQVVLSLAQQGHGDAALIELRHKIERDIHAGAPPAAAAAVRIPRPAAGPSAGTPQAPPTPTVAPPVPPVAVP